MTTQPTRVRFNTTIEAMTATLVEEKATLWGVPRGEAMDRLVQQAVALESATRQAELGAGALEDILRRVFDDYIMRTTVTLKTLLDERLELPALEASTARLLLFALLASMKGPEVAIKNEDEALRVARQGRQDGILPLLLRKRTPHA